MNTIIPLRGYYINRITDSDRHLFMRKQAEMLECHNIFLEHFPAIEQSRLAPFKAWFKGRFLTCPWLSVQMGNMGCAASHVALWMHILAYHTEPVLVIEDDARVPATFLTNWNNAKGELPSDFAVVLFGQWDADSNKTNHSKTWNRIINGSKTGGGTHAYMINPSRIVDLLEFMLPMYQELDKSLKDAHAALPIFCDKSELISLDNELSKHSVRELRN